MNDNSSNALHCEEVLCSERSHNKQVGEEDIFRVRAV